MSAIVIDRPRKVFNSFEKIKEVGNVNSQHKYLLIMELFNPQRLQTFQLAGGLEFMCNFKCLNHLILGNFRGN